MFQKFLNLIKAHKIITAIIVVVLIYGGYFLYQKAHPAQTSVQYVTQAAQKGTLVVSVTGSGQVSAQNKIDLKPGGSGQSTSAITSVNVKQGQQVKAGQVLATVDEKNNNVALIQARASVQSAQANYDNLVAGLNSTDMASAQLSVTTAQQAVDKAYSNLLNSGLTAMPNNNLSTATLTLTGSYTGTTQGSYTITVFPTGSSDYYYTVSGLSSENGQITFGLPEPLGNGLFVTFSSTGKYDTSTVWTVSVPNTQSSSYLSNQFAYTSAQTSLQSAQLGLQSKTAPPTDAQIASAQSQIAQAQSQLATAEVNYDDNIIKAPFDGVVAAMNNQVGDQVSSSSVVATIITNQEQAVIPLNEVDAANLKIGQKANLTFDAIDGLNMTGTVVQIDTIGTVSQGVVTYNVKIALDTQNDQVKPGMSVSAEIITKADTDVLTVPSTAVKTNANGTSYVLILDASGKPQQKTVTVGSSNDTDTEITSGLNEGDMVVTQTINSSASTTTTTRSSSSIIPGLGGGSGGNRVFTNGGGAAGAAGAGR